MPTPKEWGRSFRPDASTSNPPTRVCRTRDEEAGHGRRRGRRRFKGAMEQTTLRCARTADASKPAAVFSAGVVTAAARCQAA